MKNIILSIVGVIVIGLAGVAFWSWFHARIGAQYAKDLGQIGTPREEASNALTMTYLNLMRRHSEQIFDRDEESYARVCSGPSSDINTRSIPEVILEIESMLGSRVVCKSTKESWVVQASLLPSGYFCVDSKGYAKVETTELGSATACR